MEGRRGHSVGLFDADAKAVFEAAKRDAEPRGGRSWFLVWCCTQRHMPGIGQGGSAEPQL